MNFIYDNDWLNREPPYAFKWDHLLIIFLFISIGVLAAFLLKKKSKRTIKIVLISLWAFYVALQIFYYTVIYIRSFNNPSEYPFNIETMLPLHSCLMFMYVFPFAMFSKNKYVKTAACNFLVIVNMIMGFITLFVGCPAAGCSALSFFGLQTLIYHALDVVVPLIMLITGYYDIQKNDVKYGLIVFGLLSITVYTFDAITGADYFYFYDGHNFPVFDFISKNVPHIVWTLIVLSCYIITAFATHYAVIGIKYLVDKNKKAPVEEPDEPMQEQQ